jgi:hypothetical protein
MCPQHHRGETGIHALGKRKFEKFLGFTIGELIEDTNNLVGEELNFLNQTGEINSQLQNLDIRQSG